MLLRCFWHRVTTWLRRRRHIDATPSKAVDLTSWDTSPEIVAQSLLGALYQTLVTLYYEQGHVIFELGQSPEQQFQLAAHIAANLWTTGVPPYSVEIVGRYLTQRAIQECLWGMMCHERAEKLYRHLLIAVREHMVYPSIIPPEQSEKGRQKKNENYRRRTRRRGRGDISPRSDAARPTTKYEAQITGDATPTWSNPYTMSTVPYEDWGRWPTAQG